MSTKNDQAWRHLFEKYDILNQVDCNESYIIKSSEINEFREARLMTKFDHKFQLPDVFIDNKLSLLPISRGEYTISRFNIFEDFPEDTLTQVEEVEAPTKWESLDYKNITSESSAINSAYVGKILNHFLDEDILYPTVSGRMSSREFDFSVKKTNTSGYFHVNVKNAQIEIDGGFEGVKSLSLVEAKNSITPDFIVRQIYYPFRLWRNLITKPIRNVFMTYTNGVFHLREYVFRDDKKYNSLELIQERKYKFTELKPIKLTFDLLHNILQTTSIIDEPNIPFPQANSIERIINLCEVLNSTESGETKEELLDNFFFTEKHDLAPRQVDYYTNAAIYLDFIIKQGNDKGEIVFNLTNKGKALFELSISERQIEFVKAIVRHSVFHKVLCETIKNGVEQQLSEERIVNLMKESELYNINSESTFKRRSSTIRSWIAWILNQI